MRRSQLRIYYHAPEEPTQEQQRSLDKAFDILFGETARRLSGAPSSAGMGEKVDSQQAAPQGTFRV